MSDRLSLAMAELIEALRKSVRQEVDAAPRTPDRLLSVDEAAALLGLGRTAAYGELQAGRLASLKVGRRRLIASGALTAYIADRQAAR